MHSQTLTIILSALFASTVVAGGAEAGEPCGGFAGILCADELVCIDQPNDGCDPSNGADCIGVCAATCGGITGKKCPDGYECVDDPNDTCDPKNGGADCSGVCVK